MPLVKSNVADVVVIVPSLTSVDPEPVLIVVIPSTLTPVPTVSFEPEPKSSVENPETDVSVVAPVSFVRDNEAFSFKTMLDAGSVPFPVSLPLTVALVFVPAVAV